MALTQWFKCPKCDAVHDRTNQPSAIPVAAPGPVGGAVFVLACTACGVALGAYSYTD